MEHDAVNQNRQPYQKEKLSCLAHGRRGGTRDLLISNLQSETGKHRKNEQQTGSPSLPKDVVGSMDSGRTQSANLASEDLEETGTTLNIRKPPLQSSGPSLTASPQLSTTTTGRLPQWTLKLRPSETKRNASNPWKMRSRLRTLYLHNHALRLLDLYAKGSRPTPALWSVLWKNLKQWAAQEAVELQQFCIEAVREWTIPAKQHVEVGTTRLDGTMFTPVPCTRLARDCSYHNLPVISEEEALKDIAQSEVHRSALVEIYQNDEDRAEEVQNASFRVSDRGLKNVKTTSIGEGPQL